MHSIFKLNNKRVSFLIQTSTFVIFVVGMLFYVGSVFAQDTETSSISSGDPTSPTSASFDQAIDVAELKGEFPGGDPIIYHTCPDGTNQSFTVLCTWNGPSDTGSEVCSIIYDSCPIIGGTVGNDPINRITPTGGTIPTPPTVSASCVNPSVAKVQWSGSVGATAYSPRYSSSVINSTSDCVSGFTLLAPNTCGVDSIDLTSVNIPVVAGVSYSAWVHGVSGAGWGTSAGTSPFSCAPPSGTVSAVGCTTATVGGTCAVPITWNTQYSQVAGAAFSQVDVFDFTSGIALPPGGSWVLDSNYFKSGANGSATVNLPKGQYIVALYGIPIGGVGGPDFVRLDSKVVTVSDPASKPDLISGGFYYTTSTSTVASLYGQNIPYGSYFFVIGASANIGQASSTVTSGAVNELDTNGDGLPDSYHSVLMPPIGPQKWQLATTSGGDPWDQWTTIPAGNNRMRTCVDFVTSPYLVPGPSNGQIVDESNEDNNCGPWIPFTVYCPSGQTPSGGVCVNSGSAIGSIDIVPCTILSGQTTCNAYASWNVTAPPGYTGYVELTGGPSAGGYAGGSYGDHPNGYAKWGTVLSGTNQPFPVAAGTYTAYLMGNGVPPIAQLSNKYASALKSGSSIIPFTGVLANLMDIFSSRGGTSVILAGSPGTGVQLASKTFTISPANAGCPTPPLGNICTAPANSCGMGQSVVADDGAGRGSLSCYCPPVPDSSCSVPSIEIEPQQIINKGEACTFHWKVITPAPAAAGLNCTLTGAGVSVSCSGSTCNASKTTPTIALTSTGLYTLTCKNGTVVTSTKVAKCVINPVTIEK